MILTVNGTTHWGEQCDALQAIKEMETMVDCIFLDIPYKAPGNQARNRNVIPYETISPEQFYPFIIAAMDRLRPGGFVVWMFSTGDHSKKAKKAYEAGLKLFDLGLSLVGFTNYVKTHKNGRRCMMGNHVLPSELVLVMRRELGKIDLPREMPFVRPRTDQATEKPVELVEAILAALGLPKGATVLDPFAGSGSTAQAAARVGLNSLSWDVRHNPLRYRMEREAPAM